MIKTGHKVKVYSFDIFDTVLIRSVASPGDIFKIVQSRFEPGEYQIPERFFKRYADIRRESEWLARHKSGKEEISFDDIFGFIGKAYRLSGDVINYLKTLELNVEAEGVFPVSWTLAEINKIREQKKRIIFTSDMYLPIDFIRQLLNKFGVNREHDGLYLSNDVGLRKSTGNLFKYILEQENCQPLELSHFGDDVYSDLIVPSKLGIQIYKTPRKLTRKKIKSYNLKRARASLLGPLGKLFKTKFRKNQLVK